MTSVSMRPKAISSSSSRRQISSPHGSRRREFPAYSIPPERPGLIDSGEVELVFNGSCLIEAYPVGVPDLWPCGGDEEEVDAHQSFPSDQFREADVVADSHGAGDTVQIEVGEVVSHTEIARFTGEGKAVDLIKSFCNLPFAVENIGAVQDIIPDLGSDRPPTILTLLFFANVESISCVLSPFLSASSSKCSAGKKPTFHVSGSTRMSGSCFMAFSMSSRA